MRGVCRLIATVVALAALTQASADPLIVVKDRVSAKLYRAPLKAVVCLSARDPVHLSGEYGVHVSWTPRARQVKDLDLYTKADYFTVPVRVEVPLPRDARTIKVEVGACVANDYCDSVELSMELRKAPLEPAADAIDCKP